MNVFREFIFYLGTANCCSRHPVKPNWEEAETTDSKTDLETGGAKPFRPGRNMDELFEYPCDMHSPIDE